MKYYSKNQLLTETLIIVSGIFNVGCSDVEDDSLVFENQQSMGKKQNKEKEKGNIKKKGNINSKTKEKRQIFRISKQFKETKCEKPIEGQINGLKNEGLDDSKIVALDNKSEVPKSNQETVNENFAQDCKDAYILLTYYCDIWHDGRLLRRNKELIKKEIEKLKNKGWNDDKLNIFIDLIPFGNTEKKHSQQKVKQETVAHIRCMMITIIKQLNRTNLVYEINNKSPLFNEILKRDTIQNFKTVYSKTSEDVKKYIPYIIEDLKKDRQYLEHIGLIKYLVTPEEEKNTTIKIVPQNNEEQDPKKINFDFNNFSNPLDMNSFLIGNNNLFLGTNNYGPFPIGNNNNLFLGTNNYGPFPIGNNNNPLLGTNSYVPFPIGNNNLLLETNSYIPFPIRNNNNPLLGTNSYVPFPIGNNNPLLGTNNYVPFPIRNNNNPLLGTNSYVPFSFGNDNNLLLGTNSYVPFSFGNDNLSENSKK